MMKKRDDNISNIVKFSLGSVVERLFKITDYSNQRSLVALPSKFFLENWVPF